MYLFIGAGIAYAYGGLLAPEQAFRSRLTERAGQIEIHYAIADAYYLYRDRFAFAAKNGAATLGAPVFPPSISHFDENFGKEVETYRNQAVIRIPVMAAAGPFDLTVTSQGCADQGVCYPPLAQVYRISGAALQTGTATRSATAEKSAEAPLTDAEANRSRTATLDRLYDPSYAQAVLEQRGMPTMLAIIFSLGVMMSLLPCSLPMFPILSSIIIGQGVPPTRGRSLALSLSYVLGAAVVYAAMGAMAGLAGASLSIWLQNQWVRRAFAALLVVFALSLFGCYELRLPARWQTWMSSASQHQAAGRLRWISVFGMGALSALGVGACMTAPLFGVITFIAQTRHALLGSAALFALALGLGVPLLILGAGAGALLPRAGAWLESVKHGFGMILLAAALWVAAPVLPPWAMMLFAALWLFVAAAGLKLFEPLAVQPEFRTAVLARHADADSTTVRQGGVTPLARLCETPVQSSAAAWRYLSKGIAGVCAVLAVILIVGAAAGSRDPFRPLAVFVAQRAPSGSVVNTDKLAFTRVRSSEALERTRSADGRPVMLDFYADWCTSCKEMERLTFSDPSVRARLAAFNLLQVDVTANQEDDRALFKRFSLYGPPALLFFDANGDEISGSRVMGYQPPHIFLRSLARVISAAARRAELTGEKD